MTLPLSLRHFVWERFNSLDPFQPHWMDELPYWEDYTSAFLRSNGSECRSQDCNVKEWIQAEDRAPFIKMAQVLLSRLVDQTCLTDVDFVLLAHWLPDLHLGTSVTNYAMHHLGLSSGFGFAISDRGLSAPFFALECIDKYLRDGRRKALLMVMDQKHLLYKSDLKGSLNPDNSACIMVLERQIGPGLHYLGYRRAGLPSTDCLTQHCLSMLQTLALRIQQTTIITSDRLTADLDLPACIIQADPHLICSAPFVGLFQSLAPNRDYLLLTRDRHSLYGVGFRSLEG